MQQKAGKGATQQRVGKGLLHVQMNVDVNWEERFSKWYAEEHLYDLMSVPGFLSVRRFVLGADASWGDASVEGRQKYLAAYELESPEVVTTDAYLNLHKTPSPLTQTVMGRYKLRRTIFEQCAPAEGAVEHRRIAGRDTDEVRGGVAGGGGSGGSGETLAMGGAIMHVLLQPEPGREEEMVRWYEEEHLAALAGISGVLGARLLKKWPILRGKPETLERDQANQGPHGYLLVCHLEDASVVESEAFLRHRGTPTERGQRVMAHVALERSLYRQMFPEKGSFEEKGGVPKRG